MKEGNFSSTRNKYINMSVSELNHTKSGFFFFEIHSDEWWFIYLFISRYTEDLYYKQRKKIANFLCELQRMLNYNLLSFYVKLLDFD